MTQLKLKLTTTNQLKGQTQNKLERKLKSKFKTIIINQWPGVISYMAFLTQWLWTQ